MLLVSDLLDAILAELRGRVANGEFSERQLAVRLGISQSQMNNLVRGRRALSCEIADRLILVLRLDLKQYVVERVDVPQQ